MENILVVGENGNEKNDFIKCLTGKDIFVANNRLAVYRGKMKGRDVQVVDATGLPLSPNSFDESVNKLKREFNQQGVHQKNPMFLVLPAKGREEKALRAVECVSEAFGEDAISNNMSLVFTGEDDGEQLDTDSMKDDVKDLITKCKKRLINFVPKSGQNQTDIIEDLINKIPSIENAISGVTGLSSLYVSSSDRNTNDNRRYSSHKLTEQTSRKRKTDPEEVVPWKKRVDVETGAEQQNKSALAAPTDRKEFGNFLRLSKFLLDTGTLVMKTLFKENEPTGGMKPYIKKDPKMKKRFELIMTKEEQAAIKLSDTNPMEPDNYDISLLSKLISNFCLLTDQVAKEIEKLRNIRNNAYGHLTRAKVDASSFTKYWDELENTLTHLGQSIKEETVKSKVLLSISADARNIKQDPLPNDIQELEEKITEYRRIVYFVEKSDRHQNTVEETIKSVYCNSCETFHNNDHKI